MKIRQFHSSAVGLHNTLLNRLLLMSQDHQSARVKNLEAAVQICIRALHEVYSLIPSGGFESGYDEIRFFKYIKPLFASEREYHQRLHHAAVLGTKGERFFLDEKQRMEKMLKDHGSFVRYYHTGETHSDTVWFRQGQAPMPTPLCLWQWETNPKHTSMRDGWVAGLIAVERYVEWLNAQIKQTQLVK